ncbi:MAG: 3-hydroxyacyl-CoA dehydrogenase family protein, partial [Yoonia sp.]|uniref:3-hydroxyacyl-CoA dehydrogenase family protein n=1 Tax=Yoonia sp. TaxID=2212373 RepID=UPI003EF74846
AVMTAVGKVPVRVRKEIPGFIINRLTGALEREIDLLLDQGIVSPEDLDAAVKASLGFRLACIGPMEAEDFIGLDTAYRVSNNVFKGLSNATSASPDLGEKVARGELGVKSGKGWYDYTKRETTEVFATRDRKLMNQLALYRQSNAEKDQT